MRMRICIAWRSLRHSPRQALAAFLLSACAMALLLAAGFLGSGLRSGLVAAVQPFDLLVGSGGSYQMVVNTVFLQDYPPGNVPYELVERLRTDPKVVSAIPLGFGDNFRGYRIVGTEPELFQQPISPGEKDAWLRLNRGELFAVHGRGAVVGARAARELDLELGDEIVSAHGLTENKDAERHAPFTVCGILESCRGPYDRAIFVPLTAVWVEHGMEEDTADANHGEGDDHVHDHCHDHDRETTAIMVKPAGYAEAYQLFSEFQHEKGAEMVFPAQVVLRLLAILGQAEWVFKAVGFAAGVLAVAIVFLVLYWSISARADAMRTLGLLGAEKHDRLFMVSIEGFLTVLPGVAVGFAAGALLLSGLADVIGQRSGLAVTTGMTPLDVGLAALLAAAGLLGGLFGGWRSMRGE